MLLKGSIIRGPRTEAWGTPQFTSEGGEVEVPKINIVSKVILLENPLRAEIRTNGAKWRTTDKSFVKNAALDCDAFLKLRVVKYVFPAFLNQIFKVWLLNLNLSMLLHGQISCIKMVVI